MSSSNQLASIKRKVAMALSGFFLLVFLTQHLVINFLSVISPEAFNSTSHFMGTNPVIQFMLQPVLIGGFLFHIIMGINLELKNKSARPIKYAAKDNAPNVTWMSKNMVITGIMVLLFLGLHFYDFWIPELKAKFVDGVWNETDRYYPELRHKFHDIVRVILYVVSFVFLGLHLSHGFQSAFQSVGLRHKKYTHFIKKLGYAYAFIVPAVFAFIALFHYLTQL